MSGLFRTVVEVTVTSHLPKGNPQNLTINNSGEGKEFPSRREDGKKRDTFRQKEVRREEIVEVTSESSKVFQSLRSCKEYHVKFQVNIIVVYLYNF